MYSFWLQIMFFIIFFVLFPIPIVGTAVRYRATYYPRPENITLPDTPVVVEHAPGLPAADPKENSSLQDNLDLEAGRDIKVVKESTTCDSPPPTFFRVFMNVWRHDHFEGLFQGYLPHLILSMLTIRFYVSPTSLPFVGGRLILPFNILYIYYLIAAYRLIVSPHKFRLAEPKAMFRLIFTEYERAHPFKSLQYCGLVLPFFANMIFTKFVFSTLSSWNERNIDSPFYTPPGEEGEWYKYLSQPNWYCWMHIAMFVGLKVASTLIWAPVHVILTRLAIQPVNGPPNAEPMEDRDTDKLLDLGLIAAPSHLHLTTEQRPYLGFKDCFTRVVEEEGWGVLYRCWWLTALGFMTQFLQ
ncbi:hypothetical protein BDN70DRAFT_888258 [Pholiota conissans]|uniref:Uncharacterized protein n=1 Tax=Pholiota conissans TaxID=109636 RepID=A0A9P6CT84_9AGAR|nr:hypothetical protein BDN70DRAFT_888258 [Pholiota conissans]